MTETILSFQARADRALALRDARFVRRIARGNRALRHTAAELTDARRRIRAAQTAIDAICATYASRADQTAFVAVLAQRAVARALSGEPT